MTIEVLPAQLANQIAAGEVVERPASVIKELVENSLDAGATSISIDIEKGGAKAIRITDNGKGIVKDELSLALSRHATSKIKDINDLEAISSLGFRGEALASISSVSRLTLTSKPASQSSAWQANAEGRDMAVNVTPAAHPDGTTIAVNDLFFNTPARRKFLRTEKTEFTHIEEVIRRIALARFEVSFVLSHNGKVVKQYRAARNQSQNTKRVGQICGQKFIEHAVEIECQHGDLRLWGWLAKPEFSRSQNDLAYSYVNGRMMRDKLINHAIRQAYAHYLPSDAYPAFVLFLELDYKEVDVNVHPAKHEVRFHQGRYVHDFIFSVCSEGLTNQLSLNPEHQKAEYSQDVPVQHAAIPEVPVVQNENPPLSAVYEQNQSNIASAMAGESNRTVTYATDYITPLETVAEKTSSSSGYGSPRSARHGAEHHQTNVNPSGAKAYGQLMRTPYSEDHQASVESSTLNVANNSSEMEPVNEHEQAVGGVSVLSVIEEKFAVILVNNSVRLLALEKLDLQVKIDVVTNKAESGIVSQPLLLPVKLTVSKVQHTFIENHISAWESIGIYVQLQGGNAIQVRQFPALLRKKDVTKSFHTILDYLMAQKYDETTLINDIFLHGLAQCLVNESYAEHDALTILTATYKKANTINALFIDKIMASSVEVSFSSAIKQLSN